MSPIRTRKLWTPSLPSAKAPETLRFPSTPVVTQSVSSHGSPLLVPKRLIGVFGNWLSTLRVQTAPVQYSLKLSLSCIWQGDTLKETAFETLPPTSTRKV